MRAATRNPSVRIGELGAEFDLNPRTIRYYEKIGLLPDPRRSPSGYRLYDDTDRERLQFIVKAKAVGLRLDEIAEVLALRRAGRTPCDHVLALIERRLNEVDRQIEALLGFRQELLALRDSAGETLHTEGGICRIIEHHEGDHSTEGLAPLNAVRRSRRREGER